MGSGLKDKTHFNKLFFGRADLIRQNEDLLGKVDNQIKFRKFYETGENDLELKKRR